MYALILSFLLGLETHFVVETELRFEVTGFARHIWGSGISQERNGLFTVTGFARHIWGSGISQERKGLFTVTGFAPHIWGSGISQERNGLFTVTGFETTILNGHFVHSPLVRILLNFQGMTQCSSIYNHQRLKQLDISTFTVGVLYFVY